MKYLSVLIAVKDIEKSKKFYYDVFGLQILSDFGANVTLTGGIVLQTLDTWKSFIRKETVIFGNNASELYFEEEDFDGFISKLRGFRQIEYIHDVFEHSWGQRVVRFYDPDKHVVEVGESMLSVIGRFIDSGLSVQEAAKRMDVPEDYVRRCLK